MKPESEIVNLSLVLRPCTKCQERHNDLKEVCHPDQPKLNSKRHDVDNVRKAKTCCTAQSYSSAQVTVSPLSRLSHSWRWNALSKRNLYLDHYCSFNFLTFVLNKLKTGLNLRLKERHKLTWIGSLCSMWSYFLILRILRKLVSIAINAIFTI